MSFHYSCTLTHSCTLTLHIHTHWKEIILFYVLYGNLMQLEASIGFSSRWSTVTAVWDNGLFEITVINWYEQWWIKHRTMKWKMWFKSKLLLPMKHTLFVRVVPIFIRTTRIQTVSNCSCVVSGQRRDPDREQCGAEDPSAGRGGEPGLHQWHAGGGPDPVLPVPGWEGGRPGPGELAWPPTLPSWHSHQEQHVLVKGGNVFGWQPPIVDPYRHHYLGFRSSLSVVWARSSRPGKQ